MYLLADSNHDVPAQFNFKQLAYEQTHFHPGWCPWYWQNGNSWGMSLAAYHQRHSIFFSTVFYSPITLKY